MNKKIAIVPLALVLVGLALVNAPPVYAQTPGNPIATLIERIAQKFGLKQADVQSVFDQFHQEKKQEMQTAFADRLTQLVKDGKITDAQKQLILAKQAELQQQRQSDMASWKTLTPQERKDAMQKRRQELQDSAKQNSIDLQYIVGGGRMRHGRGMKGWIRKPS